MSVQTFLCRLFGGRDVGATFDSGAGTLSICGQSLTLSTLSAALQAQWAAAAAGGGLTPDKASRPAFSGDNVTMAVGAILDNQPAWRTAVAAALATFQTEPLVP
jgi:hypothetical protein